MSENQEATVDIVEQGSMKLKNVLGAAGILIAAIGTGAMEFKDVRNEIDNLRDDKLLAITTRIDVINEKVDRYYGEYRDHRADSAGSDNRIADQIKALSDTLVQLENTVSSIRLSVSRQDSTYGRDLDKVTTRVESLSTEVNALKSEVLKLAILRGERGER